MINANRKSVIVIYVAHSLLVNQVKAIQVLEIKFSDLKHLDNPSSFKPIFHWEKIVYPGYIEFDEPTKMAITKTSSPYTLKIWSLIDYSLLYSLPPEEAENSVEVRFGEKLIMLISRKDTFEVNFRIINPDTKQQLRDF